MSVDLPDGGELLVPLGDEEVVHPSGDGRVYSVRWAQDDEGRLVVLDCVLKQTSTAAEAAATPAAAVLPRRLSDKQDDSSLDQQQQRRRLL